MVAEIGSGEVISSLLLVKALLAILGVLLFIYYKMNWEKAKHKLHIHHFFTKWRTVRHAMVLGLAAIGFAVGFSVELFGEQLGLTPNWARFVSSVFEIGAQFCLLFFFFHLALEDVPHFQHASEAVHRHHAHQQPTVLVQQPVRQMRNKKKPSRKMAAAKRKKTR
ncbi:MAG: hypothetical protein QW568_02265 [Candidatus Anstonellaceae archaeon]